MAEVVQLNINQTEKEPVLTTNPDALALKELSIKPEKSFKKYADTAFYFLLISALLLVILTLVGVQQWETYYGWYIKDIITNVFFEIRFAIIFLVMLSFPFLAIGLAKFNIYETKLNIKKGIYALAGIMIAIAMFVFVLFVLSFLHIDLGGRITYVTVAFTYIICFWIAARLLINESWDQKEFVSILSVKFSPKTYGTISLVQFFITLIFAIVYLLCEGFLNDLIPGNKITKMILLHLTVISLALCLYTVTVSLEKAEPFYNVTVKLFATIVLLAGILVLVISDIIQIAACAYTFSSYDRYNQDYIQWMYENFAKTNEIGYVILTISVLVGFCALVSPFKKFLPLPIEQAPVVKPAPAPVVVVPKPAPAVAVPVVKPAIIPAPAPAPKPIVQNVNINVVPTPAPAPAPKPVVKVDGDRTVTRTIVTKTTSTTEGVNPFHLPVKKTIRKKRKLSPKAKTAINSTGQKTLVINWIPEKNITTTEVKVEKVVEKAKKKK